MTPNEIQRMLNEEVQYKNWRFVVQERTVIDQIKPDGGTWDLVLVDDMATDLRLRAEWEAPDATTMVVEIQKSRWWPLSTHMVKTEVVQTAFLCILKAEEHELRETFLYRGRAIFNTHIHIDSLYDMAHKVDVRTDTRVKNGETELGKPDILNP